MTFRKKYFYFDMIYVHEDLVKHLLDNIGLSIYLHFFFNSSDFWGWPHKKAKYLFHLISFRRNY